MRTQDDLTVAMDFEVFYRRDFRAVVGLAYALSGSRWAAEDLAQEAFLAAHRQWSRIGTYEAPGAWVRRVVANMAVSAFRRKAAEARAVGRYMAGRQTPLIELEPVDHEFWEAVRDLPPQQAKAIALHYLEDRPVKQVAEILGCSESTAKVHLHRGRLALAERLGVTS
jgi:RNA polymerase sigma-70 factor (ECF subfamily)